MTKEEVTMALESKNSVSSIYDTTYKKDEDGIDILETISSNIDEQNIITNKIALGQMIEKLSQKEKQVILLRYYRGKTQTETAKILGTSQVQISRIEKKALQIMRKQLTEDLITQ